MLWAVKEVLKSTGEVNEGAWLSYLATSRVSVQRPMGPECGTVPSPPPGYKTELENVTM